MSASTAARPSSTGRQAARRRRVTWIALGALVVLALLGLTLGDFAIDPVELIAAVTDADAGFSRVVVLEWRLPRVLLALVLGAALAIAGTVFQSLTRNPLGSPDVIGFSTGAYTGVLIAIAITGGSVASATLGAIAGGLATAVVVYLLAYRRGVAGFRLIVVGIGATAMLHALNTWILLRLQTEVAMSAAIWGIGSLGLTGWDDLLVAGAAIVPCAALVAVLVPALRQLELGDDAARAHGVRIEPARLALLALGVALTAIATAVTGPIAFIALSAPQIARRLVHGAGIPVVASALVGAALLLAADLVAQHALPEELPVGIVTIVLGGGYLLWLLTRETRRAWG
ncbi:FecCD family ABC transporter permease [Agrococcus baldri]|uniref:Iron-enterobactin transporter permease n=1 Tax=Agrococcus baldri TaxID=153730 RepID=A0AA87RA46_9MICO|nr:iron chelate uptake ABC transporter family permease subunit [Agrococcus baldri]GEK79295.1 iron-enterobactin transporter permease [Agrococcus baldri]